MGLCYENSITSNISTVVVSDLELAEGFLDQGDEGLPERPPRGGSGDEEDESGAIRAREPHAIRDKPKGNPKVKGKGKKSGSKGRSNTPGRLVVATRAAYIMPPNRYPVMTSGARNPLKPTHYSVVFDVTRAVPHGAVSHQQWTKREKSEAIT